MKSNEEVLKMIGLKNTELLLSIKKKKLAYYGHVRRHHSLKKNSVEGQGGWKKRQRTKKKELDWQRELDDENEYGTVQCEGTSDANGAPWSPTSTQRRNSDLYIKIRLIRE